MSATAHHKNRYNDYVRASAFYSVGRTSRGESHHSQYVAIVPVSRYKDAEPEVHPQLATKSKVRIHNGQDH